MKTRFLMVAVCLLAVGLGALGEEIHGTVTDPSGAVISGATVRLTLGDQLLAAASTDKEGNYALQLEPRGTTGLTYQLSAQAEGFVAISRRLVLEQPKRDTTSFRMEIAVSTESVSVEVKSQPFREQLDISDVRNSSAKDVGEALTEIDGVTKIRKAGIANDIVVRGFKQGNINVLIDGARIFGACPGQMDPPAQHVDFAEVERVDVIKGPFNVQNAGGLGATVNVVTKAPPLGLRVTPGFVFGSFNYFNPNLTGSYGNDKFRALGGYSYRVADPYKDGSGRSFLSYSPYTAQARSNRSFDIHTGWFETVFSPTERQTISLGYTRQNAGLVLYPYETMDADYDVADRASLKYAIKDLSPALSALRFHAYFTQVDHYMTDSQRVSASNGMWSMASDAYTRAIGGRVEADTGRDLTLGLESYYRNWDVVGYMRSMGMVSGPNPTVPNVDTTALGVFADYHHNFSDRATLTGGLRYDHDAMEASTRTLNTDGWFKYHNTRVRTRSDDYASGNVRISLAVKKSVEVFAGLGSAARIPDPEERFMNRLSAMAVTVGDPALPVSRNTESTAGLIYRRVSSYIKPTIFYSKLNDFILVNEQPLINATPSMGTLATARSYTNVNARIYGGELSYAVAMPASLSFSGGGSYAKGGNDRKPTAGVLDSNLPEMPPLHTWASLRYVYNSAFVELGGTGVARQKLVDVDLHETPTAGYGLMDVKVGITYRKLYGSFIMDNLLNHFFYEHLSYFRDIHSSGVKVPEPGQNFFVQLKYSF